MKIPKAKLLFLSILSLALGSLANAKPNVLLICVDDLRPELGCFGVDYIQSPNIDQLAAEGRAFHRHYVQAPTCGASRYTLLTGIYGSSSNNAIFGRADKLKEDPDAVPPSMPAFFREHGYTTVSIGKVSHHPGGRGGPDWDDDAIPEMPNSWDQHFCPVGPWEHPRGFMHGLANGEIRGNAKDMDVLQATEGPDTIYPDGLTTEGALEQLDQLTQEDKPFFLAVGFLRPHLPFGAPGQYLAPYRNAELPPVPHPEQPEGNTTWHKSGEFMKYNRWGKDPNEDPEFALEVRRHYAACVTYADAQLGRVIEKLKETGQYDNTIILLWGDHGWHLGEHAVWGKHTLFEESLRSPLIIRYPEIPNPGAPTQSMVETLDVFPTLCELAELPMPDYAQGVSLVPILKDPAAEGHPAYAYSKGLYTVRTDKYRFIRHPKGESELYDHTSPEGETKNIAADHPDVVSDLAKQLKARLGLPK